jgi:hypothetical protein
MNLNVCAMQLKETENSAGFPLRQMPFTTWRKAVQHFAVSDAT